MTFATLIRRAVAVFAVVGLAVPAAAQTQAKPFEPTVGQAGKDVVWVPTPQPLVEKMLDLPRSDRTTSTTTWDRATAAP